MPIAGTPNRLKQALAQTCDVAVTEDTEASGEQPLRGAITLGELVGQKPDQGLTNGQAHCLAHSTSYRGVRASRGDMEIRLTPPRSMSLDEAIEYLSDDELLEVTPENFRIRKRILSTDERGKQTKKIKEQIEA